VSASAAEIRGLAKKIRIAAMRMVSRGNAAHIGSVFSCAETLACLYARILRVRPDEPDWPDRDRFVMSKGHAAAGLYATLALRGFFPIERLEGFYVDGGSLYGHVTHKGVPGVEVSTGALGHGLALAVGLAAGAARNAATWRVYALLSDGECDEGSIWEAALLAPAWKLANLTAIVDYNKIQSLGRVEDIVPLEPFAAKWRAFGWDVREVDGHDVEALLGALDPASWPPAGRPRCVLAHTVKGKGVSFMEDDLLWHYRIPKGDEFDRALAELESTR
jgi:transketolase